MTVRIGPMPGISEIAYAFPAESRSVRELAAAGQLESDAGALERYGFERVHVAVTETPFELATLAASRLLERGSIDPSSINALIYGGTQGVAAFSTALTPDQAAAAIHSGDRFKYPATRLQHELELDNASAFGIEQLACAGLFGAVRLARAMCIAEGIDRVLCVSSEFFPAHLGREAIYNCTSDAACAVLVERTATRNRIVGTTSVTKGYYWDADALRNELIASYFPTARHVIASAIADAGWAPEDVSWILPHNVSARSWEILLGLVRLPNARLWSRNIARDGHTLAGDNFINLADALEAGDVESGDRIVLFSFGYGAHWSCITVEV
jgi:3-oxoacyl-[acyl-carrier-protein] synthase-3